MNHSGDLHLMAYMYVGRMGITLRIATNLLLWYMYDFEVSKQTKNKALRGSSV